MRRKEACWTISNITAGNRQQIQAVIRQKQEVEREGAVGERRSELDRPVQQDRREALQALFDIAGLDYDHYSQSE